MNGQLDPSRLYDVVVVGGGPAGLTAAIYLARARYRVLVVEKDRFGGQITITSEVINYPGIQRTSGAALTDGMRRQADAFGAEFLLAEVQSLMLDGDVKTVGTSRGDLQCFGVLLATGAHPREVGFEGEQEFKGRGVAYCATCDGEFFTDKDVFVIGGGFAAAEESVFLTKFARHVTILMRGSEFTCAKSAADAAKNHEKISVLTDTVVEKVSGGDGLDYIRYRNTKTDQVTEFRAENGETFGVFVFAGYSPETGLVQGAAQLDEHGYVITDRAQATGVPGLFAAGDVCVKPLRQVATAVGDGALAATELEKYAAAMQEKTGLAPKPPLTESSAGQDHAAESFAGQDHAAGPFDEAALSQLKQVFGKMQNPLLLKLYLDERPISSELRDYMTALASLTNKLNLEISEQRCDGSPCVKIYRKNGEYSGLAFHGVPGGHEFTSFVLGLYNAAGPGQALDRETEKAAAAVSSPADLKILVSLSCTMCPELVTAAQKLASINAHITAEAYDLNHFPALRERYKVMSVPCLVLNDSAVTFGRKNAAAVLEWIKQNL